MSWFFLEQNSSGIIWFLYFNLRFSFLILYTTTSDNVSYLADKNFVGNYLVYGSFSYMIFSVYFEVEGCGRRGWEFGLFSQRQSNLTQDLKKSQWLIPLLLDHFAVMLIWVSHNNIGQEFCYCCYKLNPCLLHSLFPHDAILLHFGYFHSHLHFDLVLCKKF